MYSRKRPFTLWTEIDPSTGHTLHKLRVNEAVPLELGAIAFDAINCLRSALDHAVFSAASVVLGISDPENTKFPFGDDRENAANQFNGWAKGVPEGLRDYILSTKPYKEGDKLLWAFNKVRNSHIHRAIAPMAHSTSRSSLGLGNGEFGYIEFKSSWDASSRELTFARTKDIRGSLQMQFSVSMAFSPETVLPLAPVGDTLRAVHARINDIVKGLEQKSFELTKQQ